MREWQQMHELERNLRGRDQRLSQKARQAHLVTLSRRNSPARTSGPTSDTPGYRQWLQQRRELFLRRMRRFAAAAILVASLVVWLVDAAAG